jgi:hypothetical protein
LDCQNRKASAGAKQWASIVSSLRIPRNVAIREMAIRMQFEGRAPLQPNALSLWKVLMAIRALTLQEFERFNSARATVARDTDLAVEWFADDADAVLGAIAYHHVDLQWSLVVMGRDSHGTFRVLDRVARLDVLDNARCLLVEKMAMAMTTGREVALPHQPAA